MAGYQEWNQSLCGCCDDCGSCICGCLCPPCLFGENAQKIDNSNCCLWCFIYIILGQCYLCWVPHCMKRQALRQKYGLREDPCGDCPTTACCGPCALCQEARFLKNINMRQGMGPNTVQPGRNY
ncbi:unnamed protein product [Rotaria socialis]|uniref:Uncharacterized protein n=1 Tax=Rotaria socialis TaxID=392032 RepID=A0A818H378_9BILA|nr:unnamed protein product [Rotaria socialis]